LALLWWTRAWQRPWVMQFAPALSSAGECPGEALQALG
jgi:hypothetical protein